MTLTDALMIRRRWVRLKYEDVGNTYVNVLSWGHDILFVSNESLPRCAKKPCGWYKELTTGIEVLERINYETWVGTFALDLSWKTP